MHVNDQELLNIRLIDVISILKRNIKILCLITVCFFIIGCLVAYFRPPVFKSEALIRFSSQDSASNSVMSQIMGIGLSKGADSDVATQQYILHSRGVLEETIKNLRLDIVVKPWRFPIFGDAIANRYNKNIHKDVPQAPFLGLGMYGWGGSKVNLLKFDVDPELYSKTFTLIYKGRDQYQLLKNKSVILKGKFGIPVVGSYENHTISMLVGSIIANPNTHFSVSKLNMYDAINRTYANLQVDQAGKNTELIKLEIFGLPNDPLQSTLSSVIQSTIDLGARIRSEKTNKIMDFIRQQLPVVHNQILTIKRKMSAIPPIGENYIDLSQKERVEEAFYTNMLSDLSRYGLEKAAVTGDITTITKPTPIVEVINYSNFALIFFITMSGLILTSFFVLVRHYMFGIVIDPDQIEQISGLNLLAAFQTNVAQAKQVKLLEKGRIEHLNFLAEMDQSNLTLEGFRSLRTALYLSFFNNHHEKQSAIITINGPISNVGKSFVSANLSQQFAEVGKRVLLVDADLRKGNLNNYFELPDGLQGFADLLNGDIEIKKAIKKTRIEHLDFLPAGNLQLKHSNILMRENLDNLFQALSKTYDLIIVDTAPVLAVSDALSICQFADINLMTFAHGKHNEREVDWSLRQFEKANVKLNGFVMNFVPKSITGYGYSCSYKYAKDSSV